VSGVVNEQLAGGTAGAADPGATVTITPTRNDPPPPRPLPLVRTASGPRPPLSRRAFNDVTAAKFGFTATTSKACSWPGTRTSGQSAAARAARPALRLVCAAAWTGGAGRSEGGILTTATRRGRAEDHDTTLLQVYGRGPTDSRSLPRGQTATSSEFLPEGDYQIRVNDPRFAAFTKAPT